MKKILGLVVSLAIFAAFTPGCDKPEPPLQAWNTYEGQLGPYNVKIEETKEKGIWTRMVFLEPVNDSLELRPSPFAITGHDYDINGHFDRVFIRRSLSAGYDSVVFTGKGKYVWDPCGADEDWMSPFRDEEVTSAQAYLYQAMVVLHNKTHLVSAINYPESSSNKN